MRRPHPPALARDRRSCRTLDGAAASIAQGGEPTRAVVRSGRVRRWIRRLDLPGVLVRPPVRRERGAHGSRAVLFGSAPSSLVDRVGVDRYPDRPAHHDGVHAPAVERPADPDPGDAHARLGDRDAVAAVDPVADGRARATGLRHRAGRSRGTHRRGGVHQHRALRRATPRRRERRPVDAVRRDGCAVRRGRGLEKRVRRAVVRAVPTGATPRGAPERPFGAGDVPGPPAGR